MKVFTCKFCGESYPKSKLALECAKICTLFNIVETSAKLATAQSLEHFADSANTLFNRLACDNKYENPFDFISKETYLICCYNLMVGSSTNSEKIYWSQLRKIIQKFSILVDSHNNFTNFIMDSHTIANFLQAIDTNLSIRSETS